MFKQKGSKEQDTKGRNIPLTPPPQLYSNVGHEPFFLHEYYVTFDIVGFHIIMLPVVS